MSKIAHKKEIKMAEKKNLCPCGSGKTYEECCEPIIKGTAKAPTAEALMRAAVSGRLATNSAESQIMKGTCSW